MPKNSAKDSPTNSSREVSCLAQHVALTKALLQRRSVDEIADMILHLGKALTGCRHGFVAALSSDSEHLVAHTFTKDIWDFCEMQDKRAVFKHCSGLWGWVKENKKPLLSNAPHQDPRSIGVPQGHVSIENFLSTPALIDGELAGVIVLGNAPDGFNETHLLELTELADIFALALQRRTEDEDLQMAKLNAEAANKSNMTFQAAMSHELRTPLTGIMGMLHLIKTTSLSQEQEDYVDTALQSSNKLLATLGDILDLTRIESENLEFRDETFVTQDVLHSVVGAYQNEALRKGVSLQFEVAQQTPTLLNGDALRIRQVLMHLAGNAIKFTDSGEVRLDLFTTVEPNCDEALRLHIVVSDTGIGIPTGKLDTAMAPFSQLEPASRLEGGAGLGLTLVKRLLRAMGGRLCLFSEHNVGSEAHVSWSVQKAEDDMPHPEEEAPHPALPEQRTYRILLAEDDEANLISTSLILEKFGYTVKGAVNGEAAVQALRDETFDCVLMDIQMPKLNGVEATQQIRADSTGDFDPNIPIIAVTAYALEGDKARFINEGMNGYVAKPVDVDELVGAIAAVLKKGDS